MQQMMQAFGQMMSMPMNMFADMVSRSMQTFGGDMSCWTRNFTNAWDRRDDCGRWDDGERDRCHRDRDWECDSGGDRWNDDDCYRWRDGSRCQDGGWRDDCRDRGRDGWGKSDRCSCGGWGCDRDDCCYRRRYRGSDRVMLVEFSLVSVRRGRDRDKDSEPIHGQEVIRDDMSRQEFNNYVIAKYARNPLDARYLRVFSRVLDSWCKESRDFEEEQIEALRGIRNSIDEQNARRQKSS